MMETLGPNRLGNGPLKLPAITSKHNDLEAKR